mmetsp:Transcript_15608/g.49009  ORF Transcript_15608/g.49009 Transcript_15608/m.49009 type:complete len:333 (-) Transcript_15608:26-1024(-)
MSGAAIAARQLPSPAMSGRRPLQADGSQAPRASPTSRRHPATSARAPPACAPLSQLSAPAKKQYRYSRGPSSRASATRGLAPLSLSGRAASAMGATAGTAGTTTHTNMLALEEAANVLDGIELIILDCDGVLWRGSESIGLVPESLAVFREQGKRLLFVTNNASKSRAQVKEKLATYRIEANAEEVVTSGYAAAQYLLSIGFDRKAFVVGDQGLEAELIEAGVEFVGGTSFEATHRFDVAEFSSMEVDPAVGAVVVGFDGLFSYQKLAYAATCLREIPGCRLVCTNLDHGDNIGGGRIMPGTGCLVACVEVRGSGFTLPSCPHIDLLLGWPG